MHKNATNKGRDARGKMAAAAAHLSSPERADVRAAAWLSSGATPA